MKYQTLTFKQGDNSNPGGITQTQLDDVVNPTIAYNTGQDLVITDINKNPAKKFKQQHN